MENTTTNNSPRFPIPARALLELQLSDWQFVIDQATEDTDPAELAMAQRQAARLRIELAIEPGDLPTAHDTHVRIPTHGDEPAFVIHGEFEGLSKREYLAGKALNGMLAHVVESHMSRGEVARWSVDYADALIEELNK